MSWWGIQRVQAEDTHDSRVCVLKLLISTNPQPRMIKMSESNGLGWSRRGSWSFPNLFLSLENNHEGRGELLLGILWEQSL